MAECQECKTVVRKGIVVSKCGARLNNKVESETTIKKSKKRVLNKPKKIIDFGLEETYTNEEENENE